MEIESTGSADRTEAVEDVHLFLLADGENANLQGFEIEPGATVPEHDHPHEQLGVVVAGTLTFLVDGHEHEVGPGDTYQLPGGEPHAAENRTDETVVGYDVFSPPRDDPDRLK